MINPYQALYWHFLSLALADQGCSYRQANLPTPMLRTSDPALTRKQLERIVLDFETYRTCSPRQKHKPKSCERKNTPSDERIKREIIVIYNLLTRITGFRFPISNVRLAQIGSPLHKYMKKTEAAGHYISRSSVIDFREDQMTIGTAMHEFGHSLDHYRGNFTQRNLLSAQQICTEIVGENPSQMLTHYAGYLLAKTYDAPWMLQETKFMDFPHDKDEKKDFLAVIRGCKHGKPIDLKKRKIHEYSQGMLKILLQSTRFKMDMKKVLEYVMSTPTEEIFKTVDREIKRRGLKKAFERFDKKLYALYDSAYTDENRKQVSKALKEEIKFLKTGKMSFAVGTTRDGNGSIIVNRGQFQRRYYEFVITEEDCLKGKRKYVARLKMPYLGLESDVPRIEYTLFVKDNKVTYVQSTRHAYKSSSVYSQLMARRSYQTALGFVGMDLKRVLPQYECTQEASDRKWEKRIKEHRRKYEEYKRKMQMRRKLNKVREPKQVPQHRPRVPYHRR